MSSNSVEDCIYANRKSQLQSTVPKSDQSDSTSNHALPSDHAVANPVPPSNTLPAAQKVSKSEEHGELTANTTETPEDKAEETENYSEQFKDFKICPKDMRGDTLEELQKMFEKLKCLRDLIYLSKKDKAEDMGDDVLKKFHKYFEKLERLNDIIKLHLGDETLVDLYTEHSKISKSLEEGTEMAEMNENQLTEYFKKTCTKAKYYAAVLTKDSRLTTVGNLLDSEDRESLAAGGNSATHTEANTESLTPCITAANTKDDDAPWDRDREQRDDNRRRVVRTPPDDRSRERQSQPNADSRMLERVSLLLPHSTVDTVSETHTKFIGPVEIISCDSSGGIYHNPLHGITLRIPEKAIPHGQHFEISIGVCLYGNFSFNNLSPVSAIVWLCCKTKTAFLKDIDVIIPHFLGCQSEEDAESLKMQFMKASHENSTNRATQFLPADGEADFSVPNKGILHTKHFCQLCITAGASQEQLKNHSYFYIACAIPRSIVTGSKVYFYVLYFLETCIQCVETMLADGYSLDQEMQRTFRFADNGMHNEAEASITGEAQCLPAVQKPVLVTLQPKIISWDMIDFWQLHKKGVLKQMEKTKLYPPSMVLRFGNLSSCEEQVVAVQFKGTKEPVDHMKIDIIVPSCNELPGPIATSPEQNDRKPTLGDKPTMLQLYVLEVTGRNSVRIIDSLAPKWEQLAIVMDFDSQGAHMESIHDQCHASGGPVACCRKVLMDWLRGGAQVRSEELSRSPTWADLLEKLRLIREYTLADEIRSLLA